ncbi:MAG: chorismate mutase [Saprospiraceae bacterium]|nr:chorismate mutase [Saprospiraceae bacterium]
MSILQANRWEEILTSLLATGKELGLSDEFVSSLIEAIHIESIQHQSKKMNQSED